MSYLVHILRQGVYHLRLTGRRRRCWVAAAEVQERVDLCALVVVEHLLLVRKVLLLGRWRTLESRLRRIGREKCGKLAELSRILVSGLPREPRLLTKLSWITNLNCSWRNA